MRLGAAPPRRIRAAAFDAPHPHRRPACAAADIRGRRPRASRAPAPPPAPAIADRRDHRRCAAGSAVPASTRGDRDDRLCVAPRRAAAPRSRRSVRCTAATVPPLAAAAGLTLGIWAGDPDAPHSPINRVPVQAAGLRSRRGRVDFVVDGWLVIECDSKDHHSSWADQKRDRRRDQQAAVRGYATYRPIAEDIMWNPDEVRAAVVGLLASRKRV